MLRLRDAARDTSPSEEAMDPRCENFRKSFRMESPLV